MNRQTFFGRVVSVGIRHWRRRWRRFINSLDAPLFMPRFRQDQSMKLAERKFSPLLMADQNILQRGQSLEALFLHIPKAGGISIRQELQKRLGFLELATPLSLADRGNPQRLITNHLSIDALIGKNLLDDRALERAYLFTVVRNPYSRAVSLYRYLQRRQVVPSTFNFIDFLTQVEKSRPSPGLAKAARLSQAAPQESWVGASLVNSNIRVFKLEHLEKLEADIGERFGTPVSFGWSNKSTSSLHDGQTWTPKAVAQVKRIYALDFRRFDYDETPPEIGTSL